MNVREDFPLLKTNPRLAYLDSAATALKPSCVIDSVAEYYSHYSANVHRGLYELAARATEAYEASRETAAKFIKARLPREIVFTRGTTEAINLVAWSWARKNIKNGQEILVSILEHHSNLVPWQIIARETGAVVKFIECSADGILETDNLTSHLSRQTKLLAITHVSNALGTIVPLRQIIQKAHAVGARVLVDAAQSAAHLPIDVSYLDCDFLAFSGHKLYGPTGIGVLYAKQELLEAMPPVFGGGDMIREVFRTHATWNDVPWKFEAGTPPIAQAIGLGAAIDYIEKLGRSNIRAHEQHITKYALEKMTAIGGIRLFGPSDPSIQSGIISFALDGIHPHDIATILDGEGVAIRGGHHCCMPLMETLGVAATARASFGIYTCEEDIDRLVKGLMQAKKTFKL